MSTGNVQGEQFSPGDLVEVTKPIWLSKGAQEAGDPPDIPAGSQFRVRKSPDNDEPEEGEIELLLPEQWGKENDPTIHVIASLVVSRTWVKKVNESSQQDKRREPLRGDN